MPIIIEVTAPAKELDGVTAVELADTYTEFVVFAASRREQDAFPIEDALPYVEEVLEDELSLTSTSADDNTITVTYVVDLLSSRGPQWSEWYITVIDAIKRYVAEHFPRHGHEVLSRVRYLHSG